MPPNNHAWPWGQYETKLLAILAQAIDFFWKDFKPGISKPHKKLDIVEWLLERGVPSENIAQAMATIIRPDGLPTRSKRK
jgi:pyruvate-formate lyase-activating enzyme